MVDNETKKSSLEFVTAEAGSGKPKYSTPFTFRPTKKDKEIIDEILKRFPFLGRNRSAAIRVSLEQWIDQNTRGPRCSRCGTELDEIRRGTWTCKVCDPAANHP